MAINNIEKEESSTQVEDRNLTEKLFAGMENSSLFVDDEPEGGEGKTQEELDEEARLAAEKEASKAGEEDEETDEEKEEREKAEKEEEEKKKKESSQNSNDDDDSYLAIARERFNADDVEGEFDETLDGLLDFTEKLIEREKEVAKIEAKEEVFAKKPLLKAIDEHLEAGGSLFSIIQQKQIEDFSKVEIAEDDLATQERIYRQELVAKGNDEDEIEGLINTAKDKGTLLAKANKSKEWLINKEKAVVDAQIESEKAQKLKEEKDAKEVEDKIRQTIKSGNINGLKLDATKQAELEKFALSEERVKAYDALTIEQWLLIDEIVRNGFKGLGIVPKTSTGKPLSALKKRETKTVELGSSGGSSITKEFGAITSMKDLLPGNGN